MIVRLTLPDGTDRRRVWTNEDVLRRNVFPSLDALASVPKWLTSAKREWSAPQDPITFSGTVAAGHEPDAEAWLDSL